MDNTTNTLAEQSKLRRLVNSYGVPRLIITGFLLLMFILAPVAGVDFATQITNVINRFSWNAIMVLAMVPMIHSGCGLNFGLPLGIISGLLGATLSIEFGFTGGMSFLMAIVIATPFALVLGAVAVLMLLEPHLSGTVLILGIGAVLMFVGGTGLKWFVLAGAGGAAAIGAAIIIMPDLVPYAASRLSSWLDPFADPLGDGHQTIQSLYAIGSGGAAGLGLGSSRQKHLFVPEPQNDFIFSILCEELGFVGACAVILLFALLLWRGITLAAHAPDRFGALLVVGFVVQVALQAVLNMAVVTNTIPNTGISLPFFSSGGTSLMMLLGEMGIVLSVSRGET